MPGIRLAKVIKPSHAPARAFWRVVLRPAVIAVIFMTLASLIPGIFQGPGDIFMVLWFLLSQANNALCYRSCSAKLRSQFRTLATTRFDSAQASA